MTWRILIYLVLAGLVYWGVRSIWTDWRKKFAADDAEEEAKRRARLARNRDEAKRPDVIELKQGEDGVFRPGSAERNREKQ